MYKNMYDIKPNIIQRLDCGQTSTNINIFFYVELVQNCAEYLHLKYTTRLYLEFSIPSLLEWKRCIEGSG